MTDMTRRHFIESAGLAAAAVPALAAAVPTAAAAQTRAAAPSGTTRARDLTRCGARGDVPPLLEHRPLGARRRAGHAELHHAAETHRRRRAGENRRGRVGRTGSVDEADQDQHAAGRTHHDTSAPRTARAAATTSRSPRTGWSITHMDALCHFSFEDQFYNGRKRSATLTANGAKWGSIYAQRQGIFTRGVLLDVAAARGVTWYEPDEYVTVADFEAAEKRQNVRVGVRRRHVRPHGHGADGGRTAASRTSIRAQGFTPSARSGCTTAQASVYGGDCIEKLPYPSERLHVGHAHDRAGLDGPADPGLAVADGAGEDLRAPEAMGLSADDCADAACQAAHRRRSTRCACSDRVTL